MYLAWEVVSPLQNVKVVKDLMHMYIATWLFIQIEMFNRYLKVFMVKKQNTHKTKKNPGFFMLGFFVYFGLVFLGGFIVANPDCSVNTIPAVVDDTLMEWSSREGSTAWKLKNYFSKLIWKNANSANKYPSLLDLKLILTCAEVLPRYEITFTFLMSVLQ